jgi:hypothetical protein
MLPPPAAAVELWASWVHLDQQLLLLLLLLLSCLAAGLSAASEGCGCLQRLIGCCCAMALDLAGCGVALPVRPCCPNLLPRQ